MRKRRREEQTADVRQSELRGIEQPMTSEEREILRRGYALFEHFYEQLREEHEEMREARRMRMLRQSERSGTSPTTSTLNSCVDNVVADQIDNMPEAKMVPEREETMESAEEMSDVVSFVLYHAGWPGKYQRIMEDAVKCAARQSRERSASPYCAIRSSMRRRSASSCAHCGT